MTLYGGRYRDRPRRRARDTDVTRLEERVGWLGTQLRPGPEDADPPDGHSDFGRLLETAETTCPLRLGGTPRVRVLEARRVMVTDILIGFGVAAVAAVLVSGLVLLYALAHYIREERREHRDPPHPPVPPEGSLLAAVNALGDEAQELWPADGNVVDFPRRRPGGGWISGGAA
jgi:hypothetical protein